ncbi:hypothetical protein TWF730_004361 [Orbilia blumenaviensis]|uniref:Uncharacterized protein n=1 Tax=Orbilia blumenaviensis TaxID=1796055 RepID=A0AAV9TXX6_9PEZI
MIEHSPQSTNTANGPDQLVQEGRGAGGGGGGGGGSGAGRSRPKSRTCAYIVEVVTDSANPLPTLSYGVKCPRSAVCAYSASYVGCVSAVPATVTEVTKGVVPTTCITQADWSSAYTGKNIGQDTLTCTGYSSICQTFSVIQQGNTFTGFTCRTTTVPSATATGGSWGTFTPTSIPTPINGLYHIAQAEYTASTTVSTTSASSSGYRVTPAISSPLVSSLLLLIFPLRLI